MFLKLKPWRGGWYSLQSLPWYYHNALVQLVRYTFLDLVTPSPLNVLFYRMMGMKIGKGVMINTTNISDPGLITLEDNVTIGGSATLFAHYAQGGYLVIAPTIIKKGATIGLRASVMGDVIVGEKVTVKPHSILLPKTRLNKGDKQD
jgi:acetyltransferase-like isoleucine patch superfamily enzyme